MFGFHLPSYIHENLVSLVQYRNFKLAEFQRRPHKRVELRHKKQEETLSQEGQRILKQKTVSLDATHCGNPTRSSLL